jgi:beta-glucosidase
MIYELKGPTMPTPSTRPRSVQFAPDFAWGVATSSYQIEGGSSPDLRGESVWDSFCRKPGAVFENHHGGVACDHYNRYAEDVRILKAMGVKNYRLSIMWPRVMKEGTGQVNTAGLAFYDRLIDCLLEHGITPWVTLFHWEYPLALYNRGGWLNRDSAEWFGQYATAVVERLSDRVTHWMTINEPQVFLQLGHADGKHAPGVQLPLRETLLASHNALRAHGRGVQAIRAAAKRPATVGWAPVGHVSYPTDNDPANVDAARAATFAITQKQLWNNTWFADPVCLGCYPEDGLRLYGSEVPSHPVADMDLINQKLDFYGVNIYSGACVQAAPPGSATPWQSVAAPQGHGRNTMDWLLAPDALRYGPRFLWERYRLPIIITENGTCSTDWVDLDGRMLDLQRIDYTRRYLLALADAVDDGTNVKGYFHWSFLDNFEWAEGYKQRFGMVHVNYATQRRTPKLSAWWYRRVMQSRGASLTEPVLLDANAYAPQQEHADLVR